MHFAGVSLATASTPGRQPRFVFVMAAESIGGSVAGWLLLGVALAAALIPTALLTDSAVKV
ncbi:hypothetical protein NCAST_19_00570 [Nocardia asteroides NBRC 15531]|uniref:Uncharacterized protein n=1 Tax=Nocardia asteroides NBRC 15531 TaxID=1110697 RepID=U5E7R5_NOCAS|nr:hypothetical protein NCAST_19_00570 [Nocardia asteroides NBRC 15531]